MGVSFQKRISGFYLQATPWDTQMKTWLYEDKFMKPNLSNHFNIWCIMKWPLYWNCVLIFHLVLSIKWYKGSKQNKKLAKNYLQYKYIWQGLYKKWSFPLRFSSVILTKSAFSCWFGYIYWKKSLMENFIISAVKFLTYKMLQILRSRLQ